MHIDACRLICGLLAKLALRFDCECGNWQKAFSVTAASSLLDLAINTLKWVSDFWPKTEAPQKKEQSHSDSNSLSLRSCLLVSFNLRFFA